MVIDSGVSWCFSIPDVVSNIAQFLVHGLDAWWKVLQNSMVLGKVFHASEDKMAHPASGEFDIQALCGLVMPSLTFILIN